MRREKEDMEGSLFWQRKKKPCRMVLPGKSVSLWQCLVVVEEQITPPTGPHQMSVKIKYITER